MLQTSHIIFVAAWSAVLSGCGRDGGGAPADAQPASAPDAPVQVVEHDKLPAPSHEKAPEPLPGPASTSAASQASAPPPIAIRVANRTGNSIVVYGTVSLRVSFQLEALEGGRWKRLGTTAPCIRPCDDPRVRSCSMRCPSTATGPLVIPSQESVEYDWSGTVFVTEVVDEKAEPCGCYRAQPIEKGRYKARVCGNILIPCTDERCLEVKAGLDTEPRRYGSGEYSCGEAVFDVPVKGDHVEIQVRGGS